MNEDGLTADNLVPSVDRVVAIAAHTVGTFREKGGRVDHRPVWTNWHHGEIRDLKQAASKSLAKTCLLVVPIDGALAEQYRAAHEAARASSANR